MNSNILSWIQDWYKAECNGDWEHTFGIKISTIDNPGWKIVIDLEETEYATIEYNSGLNELNNSDWYIYKFENSKFSAHGDPDKLEYLLTKFKEMILKVKNQEE